MKKVLIIGKNSYIARNLVHFVQEHGINDENGEAIAIDAVSASDGSWDCSYEGYDCIILFAGMVHKKVTNENQSLFYEVNVELAQKIAKKAKESGVTQFVFLSTIAVYGDKVSEIKADTIEEPSTLYGKTKLLAEQRIASMQDDTFGVVIIRPPMVYGANCPGNFSKLVRLIRCIHWFPKVKNERSTIYVENLCSLITQIVQRKCRGIFVPQDDQYLCTSSIAKAMNEEESMGHVILVPGFSRGIRWLSKHVSVFRKMFGTLKCDMELSKCYGIDYIVVPQNKALKKSLAVYSQKKYDIN